MLDYYKYIGFEYIPESEEEKVFQAALADLMSFKDSDNEFIFKEKSIAFGNAYGELFPQLLKDDNEEITTEDTNKKVYMFCNLLEGMDKTTSQQVAATLDYYFFDSFLDAFWEDEVIRAVIVVYAESDILKRGALKVRIQKLITAWA